MCRRMESAGGSTSQQVATISMKPALGKRRKLEIKREQKHQSVDQLMFMYADVSEDPVPDT